jgi:hypothetical protein
VSKFKGRELSGSEGSKPSSWSTLPSEVKAAGIEGIRNEGPGDGVEGASVSGGMLNQLLAYHVKRDSMDLVGKLTVETCLLAQISTFCLDR